MSMKSLDVIRDEHRALAAMLSGMRTLVQGIEAGRLKPDYDLFASMIEYIDKVPEKVHHPKAHRDCVGGTPATRPWPQTARPPARAGAAWPMTAAAARAHG